MRIKKNTIIFSLIAISTILYQYYNLTDYQKPFIQYIPIILLLIGIPLLGKNFKLLFKDKLLLAIPVIFNYLIFPIATANVGNFDTKTEIANLALRITTLFAIIIVVCFVNSKQDLFKLLKYILLCHSIVITVMIFIHFNQFIDISSYNWIHGERLNRADYGFVQWNVAGLFLFTEIILLMLFYIITKKKIVLPFTLFYLIALIPTGSRTAMYSLIIFAFIYNCVKLISKFNASSRSILYAIIIAILLIFVITFNWNGLWKNSSNRDFLLIHNIKYIIVTGKIWKGIGPINDMMMTTVDPNLYVTDNWYVSNTILYGIIGTIIFIICLLILLFKYIKKISIKMDKVEMWALAFVATTIFYNMFETVLYVPGIMASIIFWIFSLSILKINNTNQTTFKRKLRIIWTNNKFNKSL